MSLSPSIDTVEPPVSFFCIGQAADREHQCEHRAYCLKINRTLKYSVLELFKPKVTLVPNTGDVSDLPVFISCLAQLNEVKSLNVWLRILDVIKNGFL